MGVKAVEEFVAYQFAIEVKTEVYRLLNGSAAARRDFEYLGQVRRAVSDVDGNQAEGFARGRPREFARFLTYALGSLAEAKSRLRDGVMRGYFTGADCRTALLWIVRCEQATQRLHASQLRLAEEDDRNRRNRRRPGRSEPPPSPKRRNTPPETDENM